MKKITLRLMLLTSIVSPVFVKALGELRSPLQTKPFRYPLAPVDNAEGLWTFNTYKGAYHRSANSAWGTNHGRTKADLSTLVFGKDTFRGEESFPNGITFGQGPAVSFARIRPRFDYNEKGIFFGVEFERRFDDSKWRIGGSIGIPFKVIEVEQASVCTSDVNDSNFTEETLANVVRETTNFIPGDGAATVGANITSRDYRLDFLSSLVDADGTPLVDYTNPGIRIGGNTLEPQGVTDATAAVATFFETGSINNTATLIQRATDVDAEEAALDFVLGDGTFQNATDFSVFQDLIDYTNLSNDRDAQGKIFISGAYLREVPPLTVGTDDTVRLTTAWNTIDNDIQLAISRLEKSGANTAEDYFRRNGIVYCSNEYIAGQGDLDLDFYVARDLTKKIWVKSTFGARLPTGRKRKDTGRVLFMPTGNNGHFEVKTMCEMGVKPMRWMAMKADAGFHYVIEATEKRAAAFTGATIKNLGPQVDAKVKWSYFTAHVDLSMFHPYNQGLGCTLGYEVYAKNKDQVKFKDLQARTLGSAAGIDTGQGTVLADLDATILEKDTRRVSHKVRGEVFHRSNYGEIFAGASKVIAGRNIMRESELHIGFGIHW